MIQLTFDMIPHALLVLFIVHIVAFIIDVFRKITTYKNKNKGYYWKEESISSHILILDMTICVIVFIILVAKYILTGEVI